MYNVLKSTQLDSVPEFQMPTTWLRLVMIVACLPHSFQGISKYSVHVFHPVYTCSV